MSDCAPTRATPRCTSSYSKNHHSRGQEHRDGEQWLRYGPHYPPSVSACQHAELPDPTRGFTARRGSRATTSSPHSLKPSLPQALTPSLPHSLKPSLPQAFTCSLTLTRVVPASCHFIRSISLKMDQLQLHELQGEVERLRAELAALRDDHARQIAELQRRIDARDNVEIDAEQSVILGEEAEWRRTLAQWLPNHRWKLQYRGSRDSLAHLSFHAHCDNMGPALVVVRSKEGHVFGGYTRVGFTPRDGHTTDPYAFVFTLSNPHGVPPTRFECVSPMTAITNHHMYVEDSLASNVSCVSEADPAGMLGGISRSLAEVAAATTCACTTTATCATAASRARSTTRRISARRSSPEPRPSSFRRSKCL